MNQETEHTIERNILLRILTVCLALVLVIGIAIPLYNEFNERFMMSDNSTAEVITPPDSTGQPSVGNVIFYAPTDTQATSKDEWVAHLLQVIPPSLRHKNLLIVSPDKV